MAYTAQWKPTKGGIEIWNNHVLVVAYVEFYLSPEHFISFLWQNVSMLRSLETEIPF